MFASVINLIEGFAVAVKHHLRGETGIYYDDLYYLLRPLHDHDHEAEHTHESHHSQHAGRFRPIEQLSPPLDHANLNIPSTGSEAPLLSVQRGCYLYHGPVFGID